MNKILNIDFHFGIGFLNELLDGTGWNLSDIGTMVDLVTIPKMMYYSRVYACKRSGLDIDFTQFDIDDLIDNNGGVEGVFWNEFKTAFVESMSKNVPIQEDKKKVVKK